ARPLRPRIVFVIRHEHADAPNARVLLRPRRRMRRSIRAVERSLDSFDSLVGERTQRRWDGEPNCARGARQFHHSPKTNNIGCCTFSRSSGVSTSRVLVIRLRPERMATYCLPPASKVIGGALKPLPTLIFQSSSSVVSS